MFSSGWPHDVFFASNPRARLPAAPEVCSAGFDCESCAHGPIPQALVS